MGNKDRYINYNNKDRYQKSKFENLKKSSYGNRSNNKTHPKEYTQDKLNEHIKLAITHTLQKTMQKDVNEINQQQEMEAKSSQKSD